jgi:DNA polymerase I-like protein with 3'-5' exonuclease and polymerase domains
LDDELARAIVQYRQDMKLYKTYLRGLLAEQKDGVVHPWFNTTVARTGRTSSSKASS